MVDRKPPGRIPEREALETCVSLRCASDQTKTRETGTKTHPSHGSRSAKTNGAPWLANHEELSTMTEGGHDFLSDLNHPATLAAGLAA